MNTLVVLDSTPLGLLSNPGRSLPAIECRTWAANLSAAGCRIIVPEISDYEVRRELIRGRKSRSISLLDGVAASFEYLPLTTKAIRLAAELWAIARQQGMPTAADHGLDGDVILAAQALTLEEPDFAVATSNTSHLLRFVPAKMWQAIAA